jgi:hypothetical protein
MSVQTLFAADRFFMDGPGQQFVIDGNFVTAYGRVPEMVTQRPTAHIEPAHAGIHQAEGQFQIFAAPPDKRLIVTVHADEIGTPDCQIATAHTLKILSDASQWPRPAIGVS